MKLRRRDLLATAAAWPLAACKPAHQVDYDGGWVGAQHARGHRLRDLKSGSLPTPTVQRRAGVVIVGAGIAALACARALAQRSIADVHLLELEDQAGGNSRGHAIAGMACPLGAHYLPLPDDRDEPLVTLLEELGLSRIENGKRVYDERHLCHSPQERLFINGRWQDGLLPVHAQSEETLTQYRRFSELVTQVGRNIGFSMPTARAHWTDAHAALDALDFKRWLDEHRLDAAPLRCYLDYCCRDDYGAGLPQVSAWAGLHYFASRHGFHAPGSEREDHDAVLTWPQGNAWLAERLAAPHRDRLHRGQVVMRVTPGEHQVEIDVWNDTEQRAERWTAAQVVMAVPLFIATRLLSAPPAALQQAAAQLRHAPWLVANLHLGEPLDGAPGSPPAWDNVLYDSPSLGYVDAMHQSTRPYPGPTVLTSYWALGGDSAEQLKAQRARLLNDSWANWAGAVVSDIARAHPDLPHKLRRVDLMRYGHAMSVPAPGVRGSAALAALAQLSGRVQFAHSDLSGYSVFEEAFFHGHAAGLRIRL